MIDDDVRDKGHFQVERSGRVEQKAGRSTSIPCPFFLGMKCPLRIDAVICQGLRTTCDMIEETS